MNTDPQDLLSADAWEFGKVKWKRHESFWTRKRRGAVSLELGGSEGLDVGVIEGAEFQDHACTEPGRYESLKTWRYKNDNLRLIARSPKDTCAAAGVRT